MTEYQYDNPFYQSGRLAALMGESINTCPYDYLKFDEELDIQTEMYRQQEWYAGYRSFNNGVKDEEPSR